MRGLVLGLLGATALAHLEKTRGFQALKTHALGAGGDLLWVGGRGRLMAEALAQIEGSLPHGATLLVLPEGVMLNYLARRRNPTPFPSFMPPEVEIFGEPAIVSALEFDPPDLIVLIDRNLREYGIRRWGVDHSAVLRNWIARRYRSTLILGNPPLVDGRFGIEILEQVH
jgi:hypothetical protein